MKNIEEEKSKNQKYLFEINNIKTELQVKNGQLQVYEKEIQGYKDSFQECLLNPQNVLEILTRLNPNTPIINKDCFPHQKINKPHNRSKSRDKPDQGTERTSTHTTTHSVQKFRNMSQDR